MNENTNAIDWQAYLDGSLTVEEKAQADHQLKTNPQAQKELEGLKAFRMAIRDAVLAEQLPSTEKLASLMPQKANKQPFSLKNVGFALAPIAVAAAAVWFTVSYDPMRLDKSPVRAVYGGNDPIEAARWVSSHSGFKTPVVDPGAVAILDNARYGDNWACYDYYVDGKTLHLYMSPNKEPLQRGKPMDRMMPNRRFYEGKGIGWEAAGLAFYLKGGDEAMRKKMAMDMSSQTEKPTWVSLSYSNFANRSSSNPLAPNLKLSDRTYASPITAAAWPI